mgnify:FL=1
MNRRTTPINSLVASLLAMLAVGLLLQPQALRAANTGIEAYNLFLEADGSVDAVESSDGQITVAFGDRTTAGPPPFTFAKLTADAGTSEGSFVGDYSGAAGVTFRIKSETGTAPAYIWLYLYGPAVDGYDTGRTWYTSCECSGDSGEWTVNNIPLTRDAWLPAKDALTEEIFGGDLQGVAGLAIGITPGTSGAETYKIDNFMLVGAEDATFAAGTRQLSDFEVALLDAFGVTSVDDLTDAQRNQEDGIVDGMKDLDVLLSLYDSSYYAQHMFALEAAAAAPGVNVSWAAREGKSYRIYRSTDLVAGFSEVTTIDVNDVDGVGLKTYNDLDATGAGPYFYKIVELD